MTRRDCLALLASGTLASRRRLSASGRLRITDVRVVQLKTIRVAGSLEPAWSPGGRMEIRVGGGSITEIQTDQGLTGIGPGMAEDQVPAVKQQLIGKDPFDVEEHVPRLRYYVRSRPYSGWAGVDIALWDLVGKACGQPLYKLFGGGKDKVAAYASMIVLGEPKERARLAAALSSEGWPAIKLRLHHADMKQDIETVEQVRKAVGDRMVIMTDANQAQSSGDWQPGVRWDLRRAIETARQLQALNCYWLEEPLPRYAFDQLAELNRRVDIAIAGGENNPGLHEFREMLERGVYDILQPECLVAEGITGLRKIGALAEMFGREIVPHNGGRYLGVIAHLHLIASWRHSPYIEVLHDPPVGDYRHAFAIFRDPPLVDREGNIAVPQKPGLGVEINPDVTG